MKIGHLTTFVLLVIVRTYVWIPVFENEINIGIGVEGVLV